MKRNTNARRVTPLEGARHLSQWESFKRGYDSVMRGQLYDYDIADKTDAINYARGRAFAIWSKVNGWKGCRWKNGVLSAAAETRVLDAIYQMAII
jgi:choline dehydrogenase-like flavoprotein